MEKKVDRISSLPDPLLEHVLFSIPIKEAARTGILSKRWKGLWVSHPYISLSDNDLIDDDPDNWSIRNNKFIKIVDKLLLRRHENARIKKLQLSCRQGVEDAVFSRWYGAVLKDGLEELDFNFGRFCENPLSFLTPCSTLVTLKLYFGPVSGHKFPTSFDFPSLKSMHLNGFMLANSFPEQLLKCQNLENLFLSCFMFDNCFSTDQEQVELDQQQVLPNLSHAQIGCCDYSFRGRKDARLFLKNLITVLSNAKAFDLSLSIIEYLYTYIEPSNPDQLPKFLNLKHIKIHFQAYQIAIMDYIFQKAPNLESLHIEFDQPYFIVGDYNESVLEQLRSSCSRSCLKVIRLTCLNIEDGLQLQFVRSLFESAGCLEKITAELNKTAAKHPYVQCYKLSDLPRASKSCALEVKWHNGQW